MRFTHATHLVANLIYGGFLAEMGLNPVFQLTSQHQHFIFYFLAQP